MAIEQIFSNIDAIYAISANIINNFVLELINLSLYFFNNRPSDIKGRASK